MTIAYQCPIYTCSVCGDVFETEEGTFYGEQFICRACKMLQDACGSDDRIYVLSVAVKLLRDALYIFDGTLELCDDVYSEEWIWKHSARGLLDILENKDGAQ